MNNNDSSSRSFADIESLRQQLRAQMTSQQQFQLQPGLLQSRPDLSFALNQGRDGVASGASVVSSQGLSGLGGAALAPSLPPNLVRQQQLSQFGSTWTGPSVPASATAPSSFRRRLLDVLLQEELEARLQQESQMLLAASRQQPAGAFSVAAAGIAPGQVGFASRLGEMSNMLARHAPEDVQRLNTTGGAARRHFRSALLGDSNYRTDESRTASNRNTANSKLEDLKVAALLVSQTTKSFFPLPLVKDARKLPLELESYETLWKELGKSQRQKELFRRRVAMGKVPITSHSRSVIREAQQWRASAKRKRQESIDEGEK